MNEVYDWRQPQATQRMGGTRKPRVITKCVADQYATKDERIIEFAFRNGKGGLVSFTVMDDGTCRVDVYDYDEGIEVVVGKPNAA